MKMFTFDAEHLYVGAGLALALRFNENEAFSNTSIILAGYLINSGAT